MAKIEPIREMKAAERDHYCLAALYDHARYLRDDMSVEDLARIIAVNPCIAPMLTQICLIINDKFQELKAWQTSQCVMGNILRNSRPPAPGGDAA